jgi:hypothetical protein
MSASTFAIVSFSAIQQTIPRNRLGIFRVRKTCFSKGYTAITFSFPPVCTRGPGWLSQYSNSLRDGRSVDRIQLGARFSALVPISPGAHPASYTVSTGSFPGVKRPGRSPPTPSSGEVTEREQLYNYSSSGLSRAVLGWTLHLPLHLLARSLAHTSS